MLDIDTAKSYATEENLMVALKRHGLETKMPLVVRNREGRWTAVFGIDNARNQVGGDVTFAARHGFHTIS